MRAFPTRISSGESRTPFLGGGSDVKRAQKNQCLVKIQWQTQFQGHRFVEIVKNVCSGAHGDKLLNNQDFHKKKRKKALL